VRRVEQELFKRLVNDCITYDLTEREAMDYLRLKFPIQVTAKTYYWYKRKLLSEGVALQWLTKFSKIGFVQNHHRLIVDAKRIYNDSLRRYFFEMAKGDKANRFTIMKLTEDYRQNAKWLLNLSMGSPIVAQIKAQIEAVGKIELPKEDVTKLEADTESIRNGSKSGISTVFDYGKYDRFISRVTENDDNTEDESDVTESETEQQSEGVESTNNETVTRGTEKRIRTRNDEFIERGADTTDRVF
jgi:hypothetical protein